MKKQLLSVIVASLGLAIAMAAEEQSTLKLNSRGDLLSLTGNTNAFQRVLYSTDLAQWKPVWGPWGSRFLLTNSTCTENLGFSHIPSLFYRAESFLVTATNYSEIDPCAEHDKVNVALFGNIPSFKIEYTHPDYPISNWRCDENWNNCPPDNPNTNFTFANPFFRAKVDFSSVYILFTRQQSFWRSNAMSVYVNGTKYYDNVHLAEIGRNIPNTGYYPITSAVYCDGNIRMIPFPKSGDSNVCMGTSVIIGPAKPADRPVIDIESLNFLSASRSLVLTYRGGGTATLDISVTTRSNAVIKVTMSNFPADRPFCTVRSMYVSDSVNDTARVRWMDYAGLIHDDPILSFVGSPAVNWNFYRLLPSNKNNTSPNVWIGIR